MGLLLPCVLLFGQSLTLGGNGLHHRQFIERNFYFSYKWVNLFFYVALGKRISKYLQLHFCLFTWGNDAQE